ncbi:hypothetical protein [Mesorhizobium sp. M1163]|uniref:hypothetical protein n=1 Tax=Mesorhizobium sp. M1163 TaxID=2957065 RepID=UPI00333C2A07
MQELEVLANRAIWWCSAKGKASTKPAALYNRLSDIDAQKTGFSGVPATAHNENKQTELTGKFDYGSDGRNAGTGRHYLKAIRGAGL